MTSRMWWTCVGLWTVAAPALAQDVGATMWLTAEAESIRFLGERTSGPKLEAGAEVTVLAVEGGSVRVMVGERFGWVKPEVLTATPPAPAEMEGMPFTLPPGFQLQMPGEGN
jgi:hypothetical protein